MTLEIILEKERDNDGDLQASCDAPGIFIVAFGETEDAIKSEVADIIGSHLALEKDLDPRWAGVTLESILFEIKPETR